MLRFFALFMLFFAVIRAIDFHFESQRPPESENREITGPRANTQQEALTTDKDKLVGREICQIFDTCRMNNCIYLCRYINNVYIKYIMTDKSFEEAYRLRLELANSMDYLRPELPTQNTSYSARNEQGDEVMIKYEWKSPEMLEISMSDKGEVIGTISFQKQRNEIIIIDSMSYVESPAEAIKESMDEPARIESSGGYNIKDSKQNSNARDFRTYEDSKVQNAPTYPRDSNMNSTPYTQDSMSSKKPHNTPNEAYEEPLSPPLNPSVNPPLNPSLNPPNTHPFNSQENIDKSLRFYGN